MQPMKLKGPHKGRTILTDDAGQPILVKMNIRESGATPAKIKVAFAVEVAAPEELIEKFLGTLPEDVDREEAAQMVRENTGAIAPLPYVSAQVPSDSMGYTIEFPLGLN